MDGWLIKVPVARMGGGQPMEHLYAAWVSDAAEAVTLVESRFSKTSDEVPHTVVEISEQLLRGLGLSPGEASLVQTTS